MRYFTLAERRSIIASSSPPEYMDDIVAILILIVFSAIVCLCIKYPPRYTMQYIFSDVDKLWNECGRPSKIRCEPPKWRKYCEEVNKIYGKYHKSPIYDEQDMNNTEVYEQQLKMENYLKSKLDLGKYYETQ